jgi:hypothetical protein
VRREPQPQLFVLARELSDAERTVLEALEKKWSLTAREAGRIVYRLRGYARMLLVEKAWLGSAGSHVLRRLESAELVRRTASNRWCRAPKVIV